MEGYATLLLEQYGAKFDATGRDYTRRISRAAKQMDDLIHDLLNYGRLGQVEVTLARINLDEAVQRVLSQLAYQIKNKQAEVTVLGPLPFVPGDASILEEVLINLLDNALKFVAPGPPPRIQIHAEQHADAVRLVIEDNGIGVEPQYHERIFRAFERLHSDEAYERTGIGLAIVKEGMERLNGFAGIESQPGHGSRFWVEFPTE
jgi:light-regulated signal transduction histidine kinase (bacteriophytochrome)